MSQLIIAIGRESGSGGLKLPGRWQTGSVCRCTTRASCKAPPRTGA